MAARTRLAFAAKLTVGITVTLESRVTGASGSESKKHPVRTSGSRPNIVRSIRAASCKASTTAARSWFAAVVALAATSRR
jgi:hypothetical protein